MGRAPEYLMMHAKNVAIKALCYKSSRTWRVRLPFCIDLESLLNMYTLKLAIKRFIFFQATFKLSIMESLRTALFWKQESYPVTSTSLSWDVYALPSLPTELLLEIASHVPAPSIPFANYGPPDVSSMERKQLLLNLTQVCRSLRHALLPILWETIEACTVKGASVFAANTDPKWWRLAANRLSKQLQVVTHIRPEWASYIRTVNVTITPYNADVLVSELARCLALMPNLQTIQITTLWWINGARVRGKNGYYIYSDSLFENSFSGATFPSVQYIALPTAAVSLLACFPEVRRVFQGDAYRPDSDVAKFVEGIADHCPKVEYFSWATGAYCMTKISDLEMFFYSQANLHAPAFLTAVDRLKNLRQVQLYTMYHNIEMINGMKDMRNIDTIVLYVHPNHDTKYHWPQWEEMIKSARKVLANSSSCRQKSVVVERVSGTEIIRVNDG